MESLYFLLELQKMSFSDFHRELVHILKMVSLLQRRSSLEDWMEKLLSDIDISRSAPVGTFLELEAAARSCMCSFHRK